MGPLAKMLKDVRAEDSKLQKGFVLERHCKLNKWVQEAISMAYDPFYQFYLKKGILDIPVATSLHKQDLDEGKWRFVVQPLLDQMNKRSKPKETIQRELESILGSLNEEDGEAIKCIILKDLRIGMAAKGINGALQVLLGKDLIPVPDTQLCMTWSPSLNDERFYLWATPKINGLRGRWKVRNGSFTFLTREDYPMLGFNSIEGELEDLCGKHHLSMVDGEVFSAKHPFQTIMSIARGTKKVSPQLKDELMYYIFNIQRDDGPFSNTEAMVNFINGIDWSVYPHLYPVPYTCIINSPENIIKQCQDYSSQGWEGIVLRDPSIAWEPSKRNRNLMKYKLFYESDFTVTGVIYGTQGKKREGQVVALRCEGAINTEWYTCNNGDYIRIPILGVGEERPNSEAIPIRVDASCSTLTDPEREVMTQAADANLLVGKTAEVRFQAITDHADEEGYWSLQFPTFLKFKD